MQETDTPLPPELQQDLVVKLTEGTNARQRKLEARYDKYKLVIDPPRRVLQRAGETWLVTPQRIAGITVFCRSRRMTLTADGLHPVIAATQDYVSRKCRVTIYHLSRPVANHVGLKSVTEDNSVIRITLENGFACDFRDEETIWARGVYGRYSGGCGPYRVTFWER